MRNRSASVQQRFWKYFPERQAEDECWHWKGSLDAHGYGQLSDKPNRTVLKAHRLSYEHHNGSADGLDVCHRCDTPSCVNPSHLFAATHAVNMADMLKKGRGGRPPIYRGSSHSQAVLSEADVAAIRNSKTLGSVLSRQFGVAQSTISAIKHRKIWAHIP